MGWRNTPAGWGRLSCLLHWGTALLIVAIAALGVAAANWRMSPLKFDLFVWHKSLGVLVPLLLLLRLAWLRSSPPPAYPAAVSPARQRLAARVRGAIYIMLLLVPLSGWLLNSAAGVPLKWFWLFRLPAPFDAEADLKDLFAWGHLILVLGLGGMLVLHIAGAVSHGRAFIRRLCR